MAPLENLPELAVADLLLQHVLIDHLGHKPIISLMFDNS